MYWQFKIEYISSHLSFFYLLSRRDTAKTNPPIATPYPALKKVNQAALPLILKGEKMKKAKRSKKNELIFFGSMRKKQRRIVALIIAIFFAIMSVLPIAGTFAEITIPKSIFGYYRPSCTEYTSYLVWKTPDGQEIPFRLTCGRQHLTTPPY